MSRAKKPSAARTNHREQLVQRAIAKLHQALHEAVCALNAVGDHTQEEYEDLTAATAYAVDAADALGEAREILAEDAPHVVRL